MKRIKERKCRCCAELFSPDYRNARHQEYCARPECRKASKVASQQKWLANNPDFFKGYTHVFRMQEWRRANPGRSRTKKTAPVLQEICSPIPSDNQEVTPHLSPIPTAPPPPVPVLQDFCLAQHPVFVGLIAYITGCVLQDDIVKATRRLELLGPMGSDLQVLKMIMFAGHPLPPPPVPPQKTRVKRGIVNGEW